MSSENRRSWDSPDEVGAAVVDVLRHVLAQPEDVARQCITDDKFVRGLFEDPKIGNIDVPEKVKTVFLEEGERERRDKGSVVIEMPPRGTPTDPVQDRDTLLSYVMCCYRVWSPTGDSTKE